MTLVMTSLPLAHVFQCLVTFVLVSALCWLVEIWQLSRWGATGELEVEFKFQGCSCKLSLLYPPCIQSVLESLLADLGFWGVGVKVRRERKFTSVTTIFFVPFFFKGTGVFEVKRGSSIWGKKIGVYRHPGDPPDLPLMGRTHSLHPRMER